MTANFSFCVADIDHALGARTYEFAMLTALLYMRLEQAGPISHTGARRTESEQNPNNRAEARRTESEQNPNNRTEARRTESESD
jgi:hypothetical protein